MKFADYREPDSPLTERLEAEAIAIAATIRERGANPSANEMQRAKDFLIGVELWKADCMQEQTGAAQRNDRSDVWRALRGAIVASKDREKLLATMDLVGFGSWKDPDTGHRRAKRATAVLRFLDPGNWGTVDWRTVALLCYYDKNGRDIEHALIEAREQRKGEVASWFDLINEDGALQTVQAYREMRDADSPRTVDVELALYGASFLAWPRSGRPRFLRR